MKDSELRKRARDLTNTLSTLDIYYNVLEENIELKKRCSKILSSDFYFNGR